VNGFANAYGKREKSRKERIRSRVPGVACRMVSISPPNFAGSQITQGVAKRVGNDLFVGARSPQEKGTGKERTTPWNGNSVSQCTGVPRPCVREGEECLAVRRLGGPRCDV